MMAASKKVLDLGDFRQESESAAAEAAKAADWWEQEWLKFPTVSLDGEGAWRYWDVPADTGVYQDDWPLGERLAKGTIAQMRRFPEGSTVLRRILKEMDPETTIAQGFLTALEDCLCYPDREL